MNTLQKNIWKIYLILLPVTFFNPLRGKLFSLSNSIVFYLHIILFIFMIINKKKYINKFVKGVLAGVILLNISSLIMAIILYNNLGEWLNRNTFTAIFPYILYYLQISMAIWTNYYYFKRYGLKIVKDCLNLICFWNLILGYIQIVIIKFDIVSIEKFYLSIVNIFIDKSYVISNKRICLATPEASLAGAILVIIILPYILANILNNNSKKFIILLLLFLPIIYFTESSSVYLGVFINIIIYIYLAIKDKVNFKIICITSYMMLFIGLVALLFANNSNKFNDLNDSMLREIRYVALEKLTDSNNLSTIHRSTSLYTNFEGLKHYPILGVGNGNQGFFYKKHFPSWGYKSYESRDYVNGKAGWPGSGGFVSSFLSAYGILGVILLVCLLISSYKRVKQTDKILQYMYYIGILSFIIMGITTIDIIGNYYIIFLVSIPAFNIKKYKIN